MAAVSTRSKSEGFCIVYIRFKGIYELDFRPAACLVNAALSGHCKHKAELAPSIHGDPPGAVPWQSGNQK